MRIWDVNPGYLNRQSLLGEHRELHGLVSIKVTGKRGYSRHPETVRWLPYGWALRRRHALLAAEMALRGYTDKSPVRTRSRPREWPPDYIDQPAVQFELLAGKYETKEPGRIPLPRNAQQLWSQHKYSVMARDPNLYRRLGGEVARMRRGADIAELALLLTDRLRQAPSAGGLRNAAQHMWGHVSDVAPAPKGAAAAWSTARLLTETRRRAMTCGEPYLLASTALGELAAWLPNRGGEL